MKEHEGFDVKISDFPELLLAVLEHQGDPAQLGKAIAMFIEWRIDTKLPPNKSRAFNLIDDDPNIKAGKDYRFDVCCAVEKPVDSNDKSLAYTSIPAGKCAVVRHIGSNDSIGAVVHYLCFNWLPKSGCQLRDFPIFFERISFFPDVPESEMITDVCLPIT